MTADGDGADRVRGVGDRRGSPDGTAHPALQTFAADLRALLAASGIPSLRALARRAHYSHTAVAAAAGGRTLPSLEVTLAFVGACGGDRLVWSGRWHAVRARLDEVTFDPADAAPPWPVQPVEDGADPEQAGCSADAVTVHACKVARHDARMMVGQLELRYSPRKHAAWGRFQGFPHLDHLAGEQEVRLVVGVARERDGRRQEYEIGYAFDWHYGDLLRTGRGPVHAFVRVLADGVEIAAGATEPRTLS